MTLVEDGGHLTFGLGVREMSALHAKSDTAFVLAITIIPGLDSKHAGVVAKTNFFDITTLIPTSKVSKSTV